MSIVNQNQNTQVTKKENELQTKKLQSAKRISQIFLEMKAIWGAKWMSHITDPKVYAFALKHWSEALQEFTDSDISRTLKTCRNIYEFPPTISQFKIIALGIPDKSEAYILYVSKSKDNWFVCEISRLIDRFSFNQLQEKDAKRFFYDVYESFKNKVLNED